MQLKRMTLELFMFLLLGICLEPILCKTVSNSAAEPVETMHQESKEAETLGSPEAIESPNGVGQEDSREQSDESQFQDTEILTEGNNVGSEEGGSDVEAGETDQAGEELRYGVDPETVLHPDNGGHVHGSDRVTEEPNEHRSIEPNPERELHHGDADAHTDERSANEEVHSVEDQGPDLESVLHGGEKHVHDGARTDGDSEAVVQDSEGAFGLDPDMMLHDSTDAHSHGHDDVKDEEVGHDYGTDIEGILHGGEKHVHSPDAHRDQPDETSDVPLGATDPEAILHQGDGHVHDHARAPVDRNDPEPRPYGALDPDAILHGQANYHSHTVQQAIDGSRPLSGPKDPDVMGTDVNPEDIRIGTLRPEDAEDYHQWKSEKKEQLDGKDDDSSSWFTGFTYVKAILKDLQAVKQRYLGHFWSGSDDPDTDDPEAEAFRTPHDEA